MDPVEQIHRGQLANLILSELKGKVEKRTSKIVSKMIQSYNSGKFDHDNMVAAVGALAELRSLVADYEREVRHGIEVSERELAGAQAT